MSKKNLNNFNQVKKNYNVLEFFNTIPNPHQETLLFITFSPYIIKFIHVSITLKSLVIVIVLLICVDSNNKILNEPNK